MSLSTQPYKGARDFYPEDMRLQKYLFNAMRAVCERFGYEEYAAPILEPTELYKSKTSDEIVNEQTYTFTDRGDREVTIRPEMTPTISRMVAARRQELAYPMRLFSIANFWRYERPQKGRLREFWQLNADIFGVQGIEAEFEAIVMSAELMKQIGASEDMYDIRVNNRQLMQYVFAEFLGLDNAQITMLVRLVDRMLKMEPAEFRAQVEAILTPSQRETGSYEKLLSVLSAKTVAELPEGARAHQSAQELERLLAMLNQAGVHNARYDATLMRGFDYYTGIVFEIFDTNPENKRSMFGGGRYDGLVGLFGVDPVPTVGFAPGDVMLQEFITAHGLLPNLRTETEVYVILIGEVFERAQAALKELREMGLNVAVDITGRKLDKQIKTAEKKGIKYVLFIGDSELSKEQFKLKNLVTGDEAELSLQRIVTNVKDYRDEL